MNLAPNEHRLVRRYAVEVSVIALGFALGLIEGLLVNQRNVGVIIAAISLMLAATTLLIRKEIADTLGDDLDRIISNIDSRWRDDATYRVNLLEEEMNEWADGRRPLDKTERIG